MKLPRATYRIQFNNTFTFKDTRSILGYLTALGITHLYASPIFKACNGSMHGYDVVDPREINPEIGDRTDFEELRIDAKQQGIGWIQDIVPNHMAFNSDNALLMELLENGPGFAEHQYFDINWDHPYEGIRGKLLAPFLGDMYGECLERGEIKLTYDKNGFSLNYYEHRFPLFIETYTTILSHNLEQLKETLGGAHSGVVKLLGVLYATKSLPSVLQPEERKGQVSFVKAILWELYTSDDAIGEFIDANIEEFNGTPGEPASYGLLDTLHSEQLFKLSYWKVATEELNYRRFFTVNDLISVRVEDKAVFDETHQLILHLVEEGAFDGLRVDHIDGLYDPLGYLERLREKAPETYITVEKILAYGESLPSDWPVQGTTGYDYLNFINGLFCNRKSEKRFSRIYSGFTGMKIPYEQLVIGKKRLIIGKHMAGDIDNLALLIKKVIGIDRRGTDITLYSLRRALVELLALFPVYRTYINANRTSLEDRTYLQDAITRAKQINPALTRELLFIERFFLLQLEEYAPEKEKGEWTNVIMRFQQFTGPLMAKGFEDTTLYIYNRLISLNTDFRGA